MAQWVYTDIVKDHFMNPRNLWKEGEDFEADGVGEVGSLACGDQMRVGIKVKEIEIKQSTAEYTLNIAKGYYIIRIADTVRKVAIR